MSRRVQNPAYENMPIKSKIYEIFL
jgi:hypothetical protein